MKGEKVILTVARDLSKQKAAEASLKESEEKFRHIFLYANDAIYLYLDKKEFGFFKEVFETRKNTGIKARIYTPDRDVFSDKREIESIIVTSPAQTLLDLAGLGYSGLDIAKAMMDNYARI